MVVWIGRKEQIHKTDKIKDLEGRKELIKAIQEVGLSRLPVYGFSFMFKKKQNELVKESMDSMKTWLSIIKHGRIVHLDPKQIQDEFDMEGALQTS